MNPQMDIQAILSDPAKVLAGIQRLIERHTAMPRFNSAGLALLVAITYLDEETVNNIIDTVPPGKRDSLIQYLNLLAKSPDGSRLDTIN